MRLLFLLLLSYCCVAQKQPITLQSIANYKKEDTTKVEMMIDYCVNNVFSNDTTNKSTAQKALLLSQKINYRLGKIRALNCLGNYYYQQAIYDKGLFYYTKALAAAEKDKDDKNIIIGKSNVASIYTRTNRARQALQLFKEADQLLQKTGAKVSQNRAAILTNMGMTYSSLGNHKAAIQVHLQTLDICKKLNIAFGIALSESNIGEELIRDHQQNEALPYLLSSMQLSEKNGFTNFLGQIYKNIGEIYWLQKNTVKAIQFMEKAVAICKKINDQNSLLHSTQLLHTYLGKTGSYVKAYNTALDFIAVNDSVNNAEKQKTITEISTQYETEKKEARIRALTQQQKITDLENQRNKSLVWFLIIGIITLITVAYLLFKRYKVKKQNELLQISLEETQKTLLAEKKASESELKALKSQMNPHFIFNALNSIQEQFMFGDKKIANEQMGNFTYLTRQILSISGKKKIPLSTEVEVLTKYLELEKMRFDSDFEYTITVEENIDEEYTELPPMLIQPFVENSIKHGLLHQKGLKKVVIDFALNEEETILQCTIEDNGIGREAAAKIKNKNNHNSYSTNSIAQRLELLANGNTTKPLLEYIDLMDELGNPKGTRAIIQIYL
ncbi:tetratricopeptide repeat-containing sensor histidine kinase [Flavobacterium stagni]|uniref:Tetratricopeptide repeat protein n=1 Tax=Flavobacterium stagni TaxID=2506421 RepID=A0A4Q1K7B5_9FLAO|nr:tetratricopeptide repeat protein [Flavobacterium stagni]RXR21987.1 tetratricopeptide repeat protein [Flavobacterium stagni]